MDFIKVDVSKYFVIAILLFPVNVEAYTDLSSAANTSTKLLYSNTDSPAENTVSNTTDEVSFSSKSTIPSNTLKAGDVLIIKCFGVYSIDAIAPSITAKVKLGGSTMLNTGSFTGFVGGVTDNFWTAEIRIAILTIGVSGTTYSSAILDFKTGATAVLAVSVADPNTQTINTTQNNVVEVSVQWGTASANNSVTLQNMGLLRLR